MPYVCLDMPETLDDFYEVLKAFKEKDPDGNGKDDTYGMVVPKWMGLGNGSPWDVSGISRPTFFSQSVLMIIHALIRSLVL